MHNNLTVLLLLSGFTVSSTEGLTATCAAALTAHAPVYNSRHCPMWCTLVSVLSYVMGSITVDTVPCGVHLLVCYHVLWGL